LKYQCNKYMFNFIHFYSFIPVSGCVCMGTSTQLWPRAYHAVKTALYATYKCILYKLYIHAINLVLDPKKFHTDGNDP
jgi:hypothetical protein